MRGRVLRALIALATAALVAGPALAQGPAAEPPLEIRADNMTGSRGPEGDIILLNGHLRATRGRSVLTADAGRYLRAQGLLFLEGNVVMVDSSATITCDQAVFSELEDRLDLTGRVVVRDRDAELRAPAGVYDRRTGRAELTGRVTGRDREQRLESDRAVYWRDSSLVQARGRVLGFDDTNRLELGADSVDFDRRTREALATGSPVLTTRDEKGNLTTLRARLLRVNTESRVAQAIDSVLVVSDTLRARSDYALFDDRADRGWLFGSPRVWDEQTTVTGDTLELRSRKRVLERVVVRGNAVMDYRGTKPNTLGESTRLTGSRVDVFFTDRDIDSLIAIGSARNEYGAPLKAGKTQERNLALGDTITVFFTARKIDRARVQGQAKGEFRPSVDAADTTAQQKEIVAYDAVRIEYEVPRSRIVLEDGAHLTYGDLELRARRVEYDVEGQTLVAEGKPQLKDRGDQVAGHLMTYDLESRVGTIYDAQTEYERGLYHGERIRKSSVNVLDVMGGAYSTCSLRSPHYHFASKWMKIYLKDKLVAKPVVFYVRSVPLLALPFWVFPIKPGRHSGFLFPQLEFGFNNAAGQFVRNAGYYWAPNDYMDLTVSGDYYQAEPSWVMRAESRYKLLYVLDGTVRSSFARNENTERDDWDFYSEHNQELTPRTRLSARGSFVSSRDYSASNLYGASLSQRVNRFLTSNLAVSHSADWASFSAYVDRRQDLDADAALTTLDGSNRLPAVGTVAGLANLTETRPSLSIAFPTRTLGSLSAFKGTRFEKGLQTVYASLSTRYVEQRERRAFVSGRSGSGADTANVLDQRVRTRRGAAADASLSDARRVLGWLNVAPRFNTSTVLWDRDVLGNQLVPAAVWNAGLSAGTTFYGTFATRLGRLTGLRHVVSPNVSFSYAPEFEGLTYVDSLGSRRSRFESFGGIGLSGFRSATMSFSLDQRLQAKLQRGTEVTRLDNLLSWTTSGSYDFLWRERGSKHPLSVLSSGVNLQPPGVMSASLSWSTDVYEKQPVRNLNSYVGVNLGSGGGQKRKADPDLPMEQRTETETAAEPEGFRDSWTLGLAYSYAGGYVGPQWADRQSANAVARYQFSPGWAVDWSASYDITYHIVTTQRFSLQRDLHCWTASFSRTFAVGGEAEYYFRLGIKDQKEIYFERGTRVGSIGGIQ